MSDFLRFFDKVAYKYKLHLSITTRLLIGEFIFTEAGAERTEKIL